MTEEGDADGVKGHPPPLRPVPLKAASTAVRTCYRGVVRDVVPKFKSALAKAGESEDRAAELAERLLKLWLQKLKDEHGVDLGAVSAVDKKKGSVVWKSSAYRVGQEVDGIPGPMLGRPSLTMSRPSIKNMVSSASGKGRSESRRSSGASSPTSSITSSTDDGTKSRRSRGSSATDGAKNKRREGATRNTGEHHRGPPSRKRRRGRSSEDEDGDNVVGIDVEERGAASATEETRDGSSAAASALSTAATIHEPPEMPLPPKVGPTFPLAPLPPAPPPDIAAAPVTSSQLHALMLADDTDDEDEGAAGHDSTSDTFGGVLPPHLPPAPTVTFAPDALGAVAPVDSIALPLRAEHVHAGAALHLPTETGGEHAAFLQTAHESVLAQSNLVLEPPQGARPDLAALMLEDDDEDEQEAENVGGDGQDTRAHLEGRDVEGRGPLMTGGVDGGGNRVLIAATASASGAMDGANIGVPLPEPSAPPPPTDTNDDLASTSVASETMDELQLLLGSGLMGGAGSDACSEDVAFSNPVLSRALSEGLGLRNVKPGGIMTALNSTDAVFLPWDAFFGEGSTDDETLLQLGGKTDTYAIGSTEADLDLDEESMLMPSEEQVGCKLFGRLKKLVRNNREKTWMVELQDCFYVTASEERLFKRVHCKLKADI